MLIEPEIPIAQAVTMTSRQQIGTTKQGEELPEACSFQVERLDRVGSKFGI
jgi:hypothetical protein